MEGILIGAGDGIEPGRSLGARSLLDVAPTILDGMDVAGASEMVGHSFLSDLGPGP